METWSPTSYNEIANRKPFTDDEEPPLPSKAAEEEEEEEVTGEEGLASLAAAVEGEEVGVFVEAVGFTLAGISMAMFLPSILKWTFF